MRQVSNQTMRDVFRIQLGEGVCRSGEALVAMLVRDIPGIEIVSIDAGGALLALSTSDVDVHDAVVAAVVTAGYAPESVTRSPYEHLEQRLPLTLAESVALEAPEAAKPPVRAEVEFERVQRISVEVTDGYDPAHIVVAAGIPVEIAFSEGHGCLAKVAFEGLGIEADLEDGGALVRLPALSPGIYAFNCGMRMVHGTVTAE